VRGGGQILCPASTMQVYGTKVTGPFHRAKPGSRITTININIYAIRRDGWSAVYGGARRAVPSSMVPDAYAHTTVECSPSFPRFYISMRGHRASVLFSGLVYVKRKQHCDPRRKRDILCSSNDSLMTWCLDRKDAGNHYCFDEIAIT
jgi:hypothetical protein